MNIYDDFYDEERMYIVFSALIINVTSINKIYGTLKDFMVEFDFGGYTNGKLLIISQMVSPPFELMEFVDAHLELLGFAHRKDYIFAEEQLIHGAGGSITPYLNQPHPDCDGISWLGSKISRERNYVWFKSEVEKLKHLQQISPYYLRKPSFRNVNDYEV